MRNRRGKYSAHYGGAICNSAQNLSEKKEECTCSQDKGRIGRENMILASEGKGGHGVTTRQNWHREVINVILRTHIAMLYVPALGLTALESFYIPRARP